MFSSWMRVSRSKESKQDRFLLENSGRILEKLVTSFDGKCNPIRVFSAAELEMATENYALDNLVHVGGSYKLYKGYHENRIISVKKFTCQEDHTKLRVEASINEIVIASQLNHKNVLKLLGYCVETEIPIHVYEFAAEKGVLFDYIYFEKGILPTWESKFRIATGIANAITYMHMANSKPILHRNIRPDNIFLDQNWVAKLSDFTHSIQIPLGETDVEVLEGNVGIIAPECQTAFRFTEKSDVFSFGMLLLELIAGQKAFCAYRIDRGQHVWLQSYVRSFVETNPITKIVSPEILYEKGVDLQQLQAFLELALRCTDDRAEERPSMMDVSKELNWMQRSNPWVTF